MNVFGYLKFLAVAGDFLPETGRLDAGGGIFQGYAAIFQPYYTTK